MTFEEFFTKKRIDLTLLRRARPALYEEFRDHYAQMSEKSFDHTKKYWFNQLRKDFLLELIEAPKTAVERTAVTKAIGDPASTTTAAEPAGFKPRFKPTAVKPATDASAMAKKEKGEKPSPPSTKPAGGFKPRFKPGVTTTVQKTVDPHAVDNDGLSDEKRAEPASAPKPLGFKPRFNAGKTSNKKDDTT